MLTFGCSSSAGIYDDSAKLIKELAENSSLMDSRMVIQVLDDFVACGRQGDGSVYQFYLAYIAICDEVGVSLADGTDPDKAFPASHFGKVLG